LLLDVVDFIQSFDYRFVNEQQQHFLIHLLCAITIALLSHATLFANYHFALPIISFFFPLFAQSLNTRQTNVFLIVVFLLLSLDGRLKKPSAEKRTRLMTIAR